MHGATVASCSYLQLFQYEWRTPRRCVARAGRLPSLFFTNTTRRLARVSRRILPYVYNSANLAPVDACSRRRRASAHQPTAFVVHLCQSQDFNGMVILRRANVNDRDATR